MRILGISGTERRWHAVEVGKSEAVCREPIVAALFRPFEHAGLHSCNSCLAHLESAAHRKGTRTKARLGMSRFRRS